MDASSLKKSRRENGKFLFSAEESVEHASFTVPIALGASFVFARAWRDLLRCRARGNSVVLASRPRAPFALSEHREYMLRIAAGRKTQRKLTPSFVCLPALSIGLNKPVAANARTDLFACRFSANVRRELERILHRTGIAVRASRWELCRGLAESPPKN